MKKRLTVAQFDPTGGGRKPGTSSAKKPATGSKTGTGMGITKTATSRSTGKKTTTTGTAKIIGKKEYESNGGMSKISKPRRSTGGNKF
jgi:hypothetical protein